MWNISTTILPWAQGESFRKLTTESTIYDELKFTECWKNEENAAETSSRRASMKFFRIFIDHPPKIYSRTFLRDYLGFLSHIFQKVLLKLPSSNLRVLWGVTFLSSSSGKYILQESFSRFSRRASKNSLKTTFNFLQEFFYKFNREFPMKLFRVLLESFWILLKKKTWFFFQSSLQEFFPKFYCR